jgi:hypothetical protein
VQDFYAPPYTVIGTTDPVAATTLQALYSFLSSPICILGIAEAELVKYACNAFYTTKITFANEIGRLARKRSQECHEGTNLAQVGRRADRAHIAVRAAVIAAHRITSSAWKRMDEGSVRPRAWAVLRLMTNSNLVGLSTGSSAGLVPFRILST